MLKDKQQKAVEELKELGFTIQKSTGNGSIRMKHAGECLVVHISEEERARYVNRCLIKTYQFLDNTVPARFSSFYYEYSGDYHLPTIRQQRDNFITREKLRCDGYSLTNKQCFKDGKFYTPLSETHAYGPEVVNMLSEVIAYHEKMNKRAEKAIKDLTPLVQDYLKTRS